MNIFELLIVQPIFNLLIGLYSIIPGGDFGVSLILFTIIVRLALWPLVKKQLHQVKAMRKLQPELAKIKKNAAGNRQLESTQMMDLYKKHGVNPFRSIGVLIIQLPIFIALYQVIQIFTLHRDQIAKFTYDFMQGFGPIKQLIEHPESFNEKLLGVVDLTGHAIGGAGGVNIILVLLAVVAAITQYLMSKQTMPQQASKKKLRDIMSEAADGKKADQGEMNAIVSGKMIKFLPFFMFFIMLSLPGALALYYAVSNMVAVLQQGSILKKDEDELEQIAEEEPRASGKKATAKARAKMATEGNIIRISAKDSHSVNKKERK
jgi:YidC/Oxa1 family membrane protein insertase